MLSILLVSGLVSVIDAEEPHAPRPASVELASAPEGDGWLALFNGRDLTGWYTFLQNHGKNSDPDRVITIEDGAIHLYKHATDGSTVVMGYIGTEQEHGDEIRGTETKGGRFNLTSYKVNTSSRDRSCCSPSSGTIALFWFSTDENDAMPTIW